MSADARDVFDYALQLDNAVSDATPELSKVVERGANNVKRGSQELLRLYFRRRYLKHYYRSITYDMLGPLEAEVGPDPNHMQGKMGRGVEFGSVHTMPAPHMLPAADREEPRFGQAAADILWKTLR